MLIYLCIGQLISITFEECINNVKNFILLEDNNSNFNFDEVNHDIIIKKLFGNDYNNVNQLYITKKLNQNKRNELYQYLSQFDVENADTISLNTDILITSYCIRYYLYI